MECYNAEFLHMKKQHKNYVLLGALQPSLESAHDYLSKGFPHGKAPAEKDSLGKDQ